MRRQNAFLSTGLIIFALFGCFRSQTVESAIVARINSCPNPSSCQISLRGATNFEWDQLYVFDGGDSKKDRELALGIADDGYREFDGQFVFLQGHKIVHEENIPTNIEHPISGQVLFDVPDGHRFGIYPHDATFSVTIINGTGGRYYQLKQTK